MAILGCAEMLASLTRRADRMMVFCLLSFGSATPTDRTMKSPMILAVAWLTFVLTLESLASATALPRRLHSTASLAVNAKQKSIPSLLEQHRCGATATTSPLESFINTIKAARTHLLAAAFARGVSILIMYPIDSIKTRIQMGQANALRLVRIVCGLH